ncbi:hypothetical protein [Sandaracinobacteroides saxicola]|uniref:Uncharacterized protein n=1 Tax=Sandaracinobacteroides saxicola TaxID=2759707 RepID=A0A7G5IDU4_9SPHN|nr:hypothetical protein [Sandaracinobacteroides saxicola]QMW21536.1 hypothetical protein H3309_08865 [Sandaracinobacteroides saxicola]
MMLLAFAATVLALGPILEPPMPVRVAPIVNIWSVSSGVTVKDGFNVELTVPCTEPVCYAIWRSGTGWQLQVARHSKLFFLYFAPRGQASCEPAPAFWRKDISVGVVQQFLAAELSRCGLPHEDIDARTLAEILRSEVWTGENLYGE